MTAATSEQKYSSMPGRCARTFARDLFPRGGASGPGERSLRASVRRAVTSRAAAAGEYSSFCPTVKISLDWDRQKEEYSGSLTGDCPNARQRAQQPRDRQ
jgi:hypothetical protein